MKDPHMITFHTTPARVYPWIKALDLFYFQHLGQDPNLQVKWFDTPEKWTIANNSNAIVIELLDKNNNMKLMYNVTFFVTTGTIRVQGNKYQTFVDKHFATLKEILSKVLEVFEPPERAHITSTEDNSVSEGQDEDDTSEDLRSDHDDSLTSLKEVVPSLERTVVHTYESSLANLEYTVTEAFKKLEILRKDDEVKIKALDEKVENIKSTCAIIKDHVTTTKSNKDSESSSRMISSLKERVAHLETELRLEKSSAALEKSTLESNMGVLKSLNEDVKHQLSLSKESMETMYTQHAEKMQAKDAELDRLTANMHNLAEKLDKAQDEIIQLKSHISSLMDKKGTEGYDPFQANASATAATKPQVLLIGTSNIKEINESRLTDAAVVKKVIKYKIKDVQPFLDTYIDHADLVVLHILTNDLKNSPPKNCVDDLEVLVTYIREKWPQVKLIISLTTPRKDNIEYHSNGQIINIIIKQQLISNPHNRVSYCEHSNMLNQGLPVDELLQTDQYHLSQKGVSFLASNLRKAIHSSLNIPMITRSRSRSRADRGRGRGTASGRGFRNK